MAENKLQLSCEDLCRISHVRRQAVFESPFTKFKDGQLLPVEFVETLSYSSFGKPLVENEKTFVVIAREFALLPSSNQSARLFRFSNQPSFYLFPVNHLFRRVALYCSTHALFELVILLTIIGNALFMSLESNCTVAEYTFLAIYSMEALTKCVARGIFGKKHSYLVDAWNCLDFFILLASYASLAAQLSGLSSSLSLQSLRTLRLFRLVTIIPGLQTILKALLLAIRKLIGVLAFVTFFILVFALFGMALFSGDLRNKCVAVLPPDANSSTTWTDWISNSNNWALDNLGNYMICGNFTRAQKCPSGHNCLLVASSDNPLYGYISYDNFLLAALSVFIIVTGDYWEEEYRVVLSSEGYWACLYFFTTVIIGAFYLMNLILSVVALSYAGQDEEGDETGTANNNIDVIRQFYDDTDAKENAFVDVDDIREDELQTALKNAGAFRRRKSMRVAFTAETTNNNSECWNKMRSSVNRLRSKMRRVVNSSTMEFFTTVVIAINTLAMAVVYYGMPKMLYDVVDIVNNVCAVLFGIEALLKILALGRDYFRNKWNLLDFFVVIGSVIDALVTYAFNSVNSFDTTSIRLLRLLRILKLAQSWRTMRLLLEIVFEAIASLANLTLIMACVVFIFAVIGMQLFNGTYTWQVFGDDLPRWNFNGIMRSLLTVFRILCRDAVEPMVACFRANGVAKCLPVFLGALIVGTFVVLNLFIALLLMTFSSDKLRSSSDKKEEIDDRVSSNSLRARFKKFFSACRRPASIKTRKNSDARESVKAAVANSAFSYFRRHVKSICEYKAFEMTVLMLIFISSILLCLHDVYLVHGSALDRALSITDNIFLAIFTIEFFLKLIAYGFKACFTQFWSLLDFIVVATGFIDIGISYATTTKWQLVAIRCLRCLRCIRPLRVISRWDGMRTVVNALVQTIPGIGNVLLVVVVFWLVFAIVGVQFFAGKFYSCIDIETGDRLPVALIPDRQACETYPDNITANATRRWVNPTINFDNIFMGYLALLQVATFESWTDILEDAVDISSKIDGQPSREQNFNFSVYFIVFIIFGAFFLLNLFIGVIVDTFNDLKKEMEMSAVEIFLTQSQRAYYDMVKKIGQRKSPRIFPKPKSRFLAFCFRISTSPLFEAIMTGVLLLNCVAMATEHFGQSDLFTEILDKLNLAFTIVFTLEAIVKIVGLRIHYFRQAWNVFDLTLVVWSLAMLIVDESAIVGNLKTSSLLRALRVLRIGRLVRLVKSMTSVRTLIFSLLSSLPALFNVGCLLSVVIFMYAICGMLLFGHIRHQGMITDIVNFETFGSSFLLLFRISTLAGWDGVLTAMSLQPADIERGGCDPNTWQSPVTGQRIPSLGGDCGSPILAAVFIPSFIIISNFVLTNIFVAIVLENLESATENSGTIEENRRSTGSRSSAITVTDEDLDSFFLNWAIFDPSATQYIQLSQLGDFLEHLQPPFYFKKPNNSIIALLDLPILHTDGNELVHCADVVLALTYHRSNGILPISDLQRCNVRQRRKSTILDDSNYAVRDSLGSAFIAAQVEKRVFSNWNSTVAKHANMRISTTMERRRQQWPAVTIQRAWRKYRQQ